MIKLLTKNKIIVFISGEGKKEISEAVYTVLGTRFPVLITKGVPQFSQIFQLIFAKVIIVEDGAHDTPRKARGFMKRCFSPIIVLSGKEGSLRKKKLLLKFPAKGSLLIDKRLSKKIKKRKVKKFLTFGAGKSSDIYVTDINRGEETNFKISYKGSVTPFWIEGKMKNREIYALLSAMGVAILLGLNPVQISKEIKKGKLSY